MTRIQTNNPQDFKMLLKQPNLVDGRRIYDPQTYKKQINYVAIGLVSN
jgi:hypothetical protein